jgi:ribosomal protein S18 acetylase RimI-like enzyme
MAKSNLERMIKMAEDVFDVRNDPNQLSVNEKVIKRLHEIHPATVSEFDHGKGPAVWILLFPTTTELMNKFLANKINEQELFDQTPLKSKYEALYLCSAMVLPEYRRKGIAKRLTLKAIETIRKDHPLKSLFVWAFSKEGEALAEDIAKETKLPLKKRLD